MTTSENITNLSAQDWIDRAIACGANPLLIEQPDGRWGLLTNVADIDHEQDPGPLPDTLKVRVRSPTAATLTVGTRC
jgi:hypothetical protein